MYVIIQQDNIISIYGIMSSEYKIYFDAFSLLLLLRTFIRPALRVFRIMSFNIDAMESRSISHDSAIKIFNQN